MLAAAKGLDLANDITSGRFYEVKRRWFNKRVTDITSTQETRQASTSVGSLAGDVLATAGGSYLQMSSDITAPQGDVHLAAQNITLQSNNNTRSVLNIVRERQSGLTLPYSTLAELHSRTCKIPNLRFKRSWRARGSIGAVAMRM
ncbi:hypothetical protein ACG00Y_18390 [Roseateles sp. LYH14W]|uniref:Uncharacterized protein n=1 Tax=Pelomonas parva TaxID=3299032 RepID=A0ABW7F5J6_9BURK